MRHARSNRQQATAPYNICHRNMQHATCLCNVQHAPTTYDGRHAPCNMHTAAPDRASWDSQAAARLSSSGGRIAHRTLGGGVQYSTVLSDTYPQVVEQPVGRGRCRRHEEDRDDSQRLSHASILPTARADGACDAACRVGTQSAGAHGRPIDLRAAPYMRCHMTMKPHSPETPTAKRRRGNADRHRGRQSGDLERKMQHGVEAALRRRRLLLAELPWCILPGERWCESERLRV